MKKLKDGGMGDHELEVANYKFKASSLVVTDEGIQDSSAQYGAGFNMQVLMGLATIALLSSQWMNN